MQVTAGGVPGDIKERKPEYPMQWSCRAMVARCACRQGNVVVVLVLRTDFEFGEGVLRMAERLEPGTRSSRNARSEFQAGKNAAAPARSQGTPLRTSPLVQMTACINDLGSSC